ncbi:hypothetical protein DIPPA_10479 [Diplonema papillatum]|nr:hypothetical protein DIPPA_10479 [Diplonema papillatum]
MASFRQATGSPPRRRSSESVPAIVDEDVEQVNGKLRQCEDEQAELARRYSQHFAPSKRHSLAAAKLRNDIRHMETVATTEARRSAALMEALQKRDEELRTVLAREEIQIKKLRTLIDRSGGQKCALEARVKALQAELYEEKRAASNFREQILLDMRLEQAKLLADIQGGRGDKRRPFTIDNMPPVLCSNCFETVQQKSKAGESDNAAPHKARSDVLTVISCCERREKEELSARLTLIESRASELKIGSGGPGTFVGETAKVRKARTLAASFQRRIRALRAEIPEILNSLVALFAPVFEQLSRVRASLAPQSVTGGDV